MEPESPTYQHLRAEGERLRRSVIEGPRADEGLGALENEIRLWQSRCAAVVAARSPGLLVDFQVQAGSALPRPSDGTTSAESDVSLLATLARWLRALHRAQLLDAAATAPAGAAPVGPRPAPVPNPGY
jgi:hypothetical protein